MPEKTIVSGGSYNEQTGSTVELKPALFHKILQDDGGAHFVNEAFVPAFLFSKAHLTDDFFGFFRRIALVLHGYFHLRKGTLQLPDETHHQMRYLSRIAVGIFGFAHNNDFDCFFCHVFHQEAQYLIGRDGIQSTCNDLERVAHCDAGAFGAVVNAYYSCHGAKIKKVAGNPTQRPARQPFPP